MGEATVRACTVARSGARLLHARACPWLARRGHLVWGVWGGVNKCDAVLDALVTQWKRREVEGE